MVDVYKDKRRTILPLLKVGKAIILYDIYLFFLRERRKKLAAKESNDVFIFFNNALMSNVSIGGIKE